MSTILSILYGIVSNSA